MEKIDKPKPHFVIKDIITNEEVWKGIEEKKSITNTICTRQKK